MPLIRPVGITIILKLYYFYRKKLFSSLLQKANKNNLRFDSGNETYTQFVDWVLF